MVLFQWRKTAARPWLRLRRSGRVVRSEGRQVIVIILIFKYMDSNFYSCSCSFVSICRILLLFDAHKLDISDEFRSSIEAMKVDTIKIRVGNS